MLTAFRLLTIAFIAALAPAAYAASTVPVCANLNNGNMRVVNSASDCRQNESFLNLAGGTTTPVVGAWFGIARPCPPPAGDTSPTHAAFCQAICGVCPSVSGILPPEVPLMVTLSDDGKMRVDDAGEIVLFHTSGHGQWTFSQNDGLPDRPGTQRFKGTTLWFAQTPPSFGLLGNAVRQRLVTYSDPQDPDRMLGFIQPYFFPIAVPPGTINVSPSADPLDSNHIPTVDPLVSPLPAGCDLTKGCEGTYHFVIRRIKDQ
jgi:hypothetical protein